MVLLHSLHLQLMPHVYVVSGVTALPFTCSFNATCVCCKWCCPSTRSRGVPWCITALPSTRSRVVVLVGYYVSVCLCVLCIGLLCFIYVLVCYVYVLFMYWYLCISLLCCVCCLSVCSLPPCNKHTCFAFTASRLALDCIISCLHVAQSGTFSTLCWC